ncbi:hypothetical protein [Paucibacter sp. DJ2R-2]|uniref:hypothetical protein n=1 Tax=Paucibacter sp. DJ2R-2 TaxID=2893558 RepID=UPI0021E3651A|nr:hypothetical protein [Paucibacter sp. DJ2R-2]MCV2420042.1 hypothetical protein [Paucibacter sp. DJ4R-1]MCV2437031.1 hypothetical protein [Paucibacter sp. DJ2R-2]
MLKLVFSPRVQRLAATIANGQSLIELASTPNFIAALHQATDEGRPAVAGVGAMVQAHLQGTDGRSARSLIGMAVRQIMEQTGFELEKEGVKLRGDEVFSAGSRYRRKPTMLAQSVSESLLTRILAGLNDSELKQLIAMSKAQLQLRV